MKRVILFPAAGWKRSTDTRGRVMKRKRYYEKYFEDFKENIVPNKNGKGTHREYVYEGYYYRQDLTRTRQILLRVCYVLLFGLELYFFIRGGFSAASRNQNPAVVVCQGLNMLCFIWLAWILIFYVAAPRDMTVYQYKSTALQLVKALKLSMAALLLLLICTAFAEIYGAGVDVHGLISGAGSQAAAAILSIVWFLTEKSMKYKKLPNYCKGEE